MKHHENHHHHHTSGRLFLSILLNAMITIVEAAGGIFSGSLALLSDAIHNLSDTFALIIAFAANKMGHRKPNARRTFGYKRLEILSAFINSSILTGLSIYLIYEAILRFLEPVTVKSGLMFFVAVIGLLGNLFSMLFLHKDSRQSLNVKAAYLHLLGDTLSSLAVIGGATLIYFFQIAWIDPLLTILISIVIVIQAYGILRESIDILMQSTPNSIKLDEVKAVIEKHPQIRNVHHVHCWQMQDHDILFEAHIEITRDITVSESNRLLSEIEHLLKEQFGITHTTFQIEFGYCDDTEMIKQPATN